MVAVLFCWPIQRSYIFSTQIQRAQLDAQAQESLKSSLTDQILEQQAIAKWDGKMPQYVGSGSIFNIPLTK